MAAQKNKTKKKNKSPAIPVTAENKCRLCTGTKCCQYITMQIDTPISIADFDTLLWQVAHRHVQFYKDSDGWFMLVVDASCEHITSKGQCGIYDQRPMICRSYSNDECEFDSSAEEGFDLFFDNYQSLDEYCRKRYKRWDQRFEKLARKTQ